MSAYGIFPPTARPPRGLANTVGAAHTRVRPTWQGCREKPPAHPHHSVGSPPTCKGQAATRICASLDGVSSYPLRLVFATPHGDGGVKSDEVVHFTLDALESTTLTVGVGG